MADRKQIARDAPADAPHRICIRLLVARSPRVTVLLAPDAQLTILRITSQPFSHTTTGGDHVDREADEGAPAHITHAVRVTTQLRLHLPGVHGRAETPTGYGRETERLQDMDTAVSSAHGHTENDHSLGCGGAVGTPRHGGAAAAADQHRLALPLRFVCVSKKEESLLAR